MQSTVSRNANGLICRASNPGSDRVTSCAGNIQHDTRDIRARNAHRAGRAVVREYKHTRSTSGFSGINFLTEGTGTAFYQSNSAIIEVIRVTGIQTTQWIAIFPRKFYRVIHNSRGEGNLPGKRGDVLI